jgi:diacylglycerol kinase family enzyme
MTAKVILNPYAGRWKALKRLAEVETALQEAHIEYELAITESPGHGTNLAFQSVIKGCKRQLRYTNAFSWNHAARFCQ